METQSINPVEAGNLVFYVAAPPERRPPVMASLPEGPVSATVHHVHSPRLVDLIVGETDADRVYVRGVPFLYPGEPDPLSPMGRAHREREHVERDYSAVHAVHEGLRQAEGEPDDAWADRKAYADAQRAGASE